MPVNGSFAPRSGRSVTAAAAIRLAGLADSVAC
jgi:hypothetical protein